MNTFPPYEHLIRKYNVPGPRYTSYPTVPHWDTNSFSEEQWTQSVKASFWENNPDGISLYIHLPFCENLCTFCGCHKHVTKQHHWEGPYIEALLTEWSMYRALMPVPPVIREIHLGGGTPTFFQPENLRKLIEGLLDNAIVHYLHEFGFEGHPNNTTREHLEVLSDLGFTRVSFGVQDYNPMVQQTINRIQPFENVERVHNWARELGYTSISHDLVFGLPHQTRDMITESIRLTNSLRPDRISLYSYAHVPWIKGVGQRGFDKNDLPANEEKRALYDAAREQLETNGYHEIGMDHFALETDPLYTAWKDRHLHRNFMGYTTNPTRLLIGLGMSAISDSWTSFAQNVKTVKEYLALTQAGELPVFRGHHHTNEDLVFRQHILQLMCCFETRWDDNFRRHDSFLPILNKLEPLVWDGLVKISEDGLIVTERGRPFVRNVCMAFDLHLERKQSQQPQFSQTI